jgi:hypothetical protein
MNRLDALAFLPRIEPPDQKFGQIPMEQPRRYSTTEWHDTERIANDR